MNNEELRKRIAEAKGWTQVRWDTSSSDEGTHSEWLRGREPNGPHDASEVPNWPESIADAWELLGEVHSWSLRRMKEGAVGVFVHLNYAGPNRMSSKLEQVDVDLPDAPPEMFPRAICMAFLAAQKGGGRGE